MVQPLYCSAANAGMWGEGGYGDGSTHYMWLSSILLLPWLPGISHHSILLHIPLICLCSQQQPLAWDCSTIPKLQLPATVPSRGPVFLSGICMAAARTFWFSFHLGCHRSAVLLSALNVYPVTQTVPDVAIGTLLQFPPSKGRSSPTNPPVFPPNSFALLNFTWFYIFFSTCQVLMSTLSRCSACTSVSEGVFLMYPWREMFSTSTYSSAILFSLYSLLKITHQSKRKS